MALVPIRCPSCGASVDLEEGQTIVRCSYCRTTSYLPRPIVAPPVQVTAPPGAPVHGPPAQASRGAVVAIVAVAILVIGGLAFMFMKGGVGADYLTDATAVEGILEDGLGADARFLKMTLSGRHTYVEVLNDDGTIVVHRFDGGMARAPAPNGKVDDLPSARKRAFQLDDVDFAVVSQIVKHAERRTEKGEPAHVTLERNPPRRPVLLWSVSMKVAGSYETFHYTTDGEALVEEPLDFLGLTKEATERIEQSLGKSKRLIQIGLNRDHVFIEVMAPKSQTDTDRFQLWSDGIVTAPEPYTSDADAAKLAAEVFAPEAIDWSAARKAFEDASSHLGAEVKSATIRRIDGAMAVVVYAQTDRGAGRNATYDAKGNRRDR